MRARNWTRMRVTTEDKDDMRTRTTSIAALCLTAAILAAPGAARAQAPAAAKPFAVEYYYKVKWGHYQEFLDLYKKNHYPILQRQVRLGRILRMSAVTPVNHGPESARWDFRFTIVWKDAATAHDDFDHMPMVRELYPDQATFMKEEQRRFSLLLEHTDVPVDEVDLSEWK